MPHLKLIFHNTLLHPTRVDIQSLSLVSSVHLLPTIHQVATELSTTVMTHPISHEDKLSQGNF